MVWGSGDHGEKGKRDHIERKREVNIMSIELKILDLIQILHTPFLDRLMCFVTKLGNAGAIWILAAAILLLIPKTRKTGAVVVVALLIDAILCNGILKPFIARIRPCDINPEISLLIPKPDDFSFPSGHTAAAFTTAAALYFTREKNLWKPALVLAVLIAFSRLYLYVHYPTDVLGGIAVGVLAGYTGWEIINPTSNPHP